VFADWSQEATTKETPAIAFHPVMPDVRNAYPEGERQVADLEKEIAAYEAMQSSLEASSWGRWALVYNERLVDTFETFDDAAAAAVRKFGRGPYLIRQIGSPPVVLPASVMYTFQHG
jgi:hypothetical protein